MWRHVYLKTLSLRRNSNCNMVDKIKADHHTNEFLTELNQTVATIGVEATTQVLKTARDIQVVETPEQKQVDFVIGLCCGYLGISKEYMLLSSNKSFKKTLAFSLCVFFLNKYFDFQFTELVPYVGMTKQWISFRAKSIRLYNFKRKPRTDDEKVTVEAYEHCRGKIIEYVKTVK